MALLGNNLVNNGRLGAPGNQSGGQQNSGADPTSTYTPGNNVQDSGITPGVLNMNWANGTANPPTAPGTYSPFGAGGTGGSTPSYFGSGSQNINGGGVNGGGTGSGGGSTDGSGGSSGTTGPGTTVDTSGTTPPATTTGMTPQQALQMLQTGQGTAAQLAQANQTYYGSPAGTAGTYQPSTAPANTNAATLANPNGTQQPGASGTYGGNYDPGGGYNPNQYATAQTAQQLAQSLGGNVVSTNSLASPVSNPAQMNQNEVQLANGFTGNAGLMNQFVQAFGPQRAMQMFQDQANLGGSGSASQVGPAGGTNMWTAGPAAGSSVAGSAPTYGTPSGGSLGQLNTATGGGGGAANTPNWSGRPPATQQAPAQTQQNAAATQGQFQQPAWSPYGQSGFANPMLGMQNLGSMGNLMGNISGQNPNSGYSPLGGFLGISNMMQSPQASGLPMGTSNMIQGTAFSPAVQQQFQQQAAQNAASQAANPSTPYQYSPQQVAAQQQRTQQSQQLMNWLSQMMGPQTGAGGMGSLQYPTSSSSLFYPQQ